MYFYVVLYVYNVFQYKYLSDYIIVKIKKLGKYFFVYLICFKLMRMKNTKLNSDINSQDGKKNMYVNFLCKLLVK